MKPEVHPEYNSVVFVDGDHEFVTRSTMKSNKTREIDGTEHYVIDIAISSASHPFWTGSQKIIDTAGRVERFNRKYGRQ